VRRASQQLLLGVLLIAGAVVIWAQFSQAFMTR
jgi:hypothetical protein